MSKAFAITLGIGLLLTGLVAWSFFAGTKGNYLVPEGKVGKVRSISVDANETFAVVDFSVTNPSDRDMLVRGLECDLLPESGGPVHGGIVAASTIPNVFTTFPVLGEIYNPALKARDVIGPHQTVDRMVGVRFDVKDGTFDRRSGIVLRIEDITGPTLELRTK